MALALAIGYLFAHKGQEIAVEQNLATAARKTADGVALAIAGRSNATRHLAASPEILDALRTHRAGADFDTAEILRLFEKEARETGELQSSFTLYDAEGTPLLWMREWAGLGNRAPGAPSPQPDWPREIDQTQMVWLTRDDSRQHYAFVAAPIRDPEDGSLLGFIRDEQRVDDLLSFVLSPNQPRFGSPVGQDVYEVVFLDKQYPVAAQARPGPGSPLIEPSAVHEALRKELMAPVPGSPEAAAYTGPPLSGTMSIPDYGIGANRQPVLLAYHRLLDKPPLYVVVYRNRADVFRNINLAAILTIVLSMTVIGAFCVMAYRSVHNNIIRPVSLLNEGAQIIRQGDLELKLKIGTGDEIEELANSFNKMATALRLNINQLEASEENYRSLVTSMRDGICQADANGRIIFVNPAGIEILGLGSAEEATGVSMRELFVEEMDFERLGRELERTHFIDRTRVWLRKRDNDTICLEITASEMRDEDGQVCGMEGTFRDVTQSVRLEQKARERSERISAINQIANVINSSLEAGRVFESVIGELRKLVHLDAASITLLQPDASVIEVRPLWPESEAPPARYAADAPGSLAAWVAREHRYLVVKDLRTYSEVPPPEFPSDIVSGISVPLYASGRILGTLNLGSLKPDSFRRHEIDVLEQMAPHVAVAIRNAELLADLQRSLEEVTRAREELRKANDELKTLDEMKTNLLSNVSHELRTPLVAVMGYTDMILNGKAGAVTDMQHEYLTIALRNIEKLVTLIENLLDFSRLHRGQEELVFDAFDLVDCARSSLQIIKPVADSRSIAVVLEAPDGPLMVEGDKGKLGQVFNNLLSNAVKFNQNGGEVRVLVHINADMAEVVVSDTGIGMPPEALDKVFTRFYQYDGSSTRKYGGTGIGLAIAQDIMRLHGSRLTVTSELGKGSAFRFLLPLRASDIARDGDRPPPLPTETHLLIEIVTQDRALSVQLRNMLISEGMDVIHASFPAFAITLANKYNPDCLLVDTEAGPLGSVVLDEILADPSAINVPVVMLTNDDGLFARYRQHVAGRIHRGFRKSTVLSAIHYALSRGLAAGEQLGSKVLCVDDDPEILTFMSRCLEAEGYEVDTCDCGEKALEMAMTSQYWMVLLDVAMPGIDGWETCKRLREEVRLSGIKVYIVTAKPVDKGMRAVQDAGADGMLSKPFKAEDLVALVQGFASRVPHLA